MEVPIAAELLGITSRELVEHVYYRRIRYVIVDGIPLIPRSALDEYRRAAPAS